MNKFSIYYCLLTICSVAQGANEIRAFSPGITTAYSVVREVDGDVWYVSGQVFEAWGTGGRDADDYDIALVDKTGGMFVGDMDTNIGAGDYHVVSHYQVGGAPDDDDPAVWQEYGDWDGTAWIPGATNAGDVWEELVADHTGETTFGGEMGGLDPNVTLILADTDELQQDHADGGRLDVIWDAIKAMTDLIAIQSTTVKDVNDANNFTIEDAVDVNDALRFHIIMVIDATDSHGELRFIDHYDENSSDPNVWVDEPFSFLPATGDVVHIMGTGYGGYLYKIMKKASQSGGTVNVIDTTRRRVTRSSTKQVGNINEDTFDMPGWP